MKWKVLACVGLLITSSAFATIEKNYDKFKNESTVRSDLIPATVTKGAGTHGIALVSVFEGTEVTGATPTSTTLAVLYSGDGWRYLNHSRTATLIFIGADEQRVEIPIGAHDGDVKLGGVTEILVFRLSPEQVKEITSMKVLEFQVAGTNLKIDPAGMRLLREFGRETGALPKPPPRPGVVAFTTTDQGRRLQGTIDDHRSAVAEEEQAVAERAARHPDVIALTRKIAELEERKKQLKGQAKLDASRDANIARDDLKALMSKLLTEDEKLLSARAALSAAEAVFAQAKAQHDAEQRRIQNEYAAQYGDN